MNSAPSRTQTWDQRNKKTIDLGTPIILHYNKTQIMKTRTKLYVSGSKQFTSKIIMWEKNAQSLLRLGTPFI